MVPYMPPALAGILIAPFVPAGYLLGYAAIVTGGLLSVALLGLACRPFRMVPA